MADILEYLNTIKNAVYGKDVRQAIVDGISQCYTDGKAGVNDLQARQLIEAVAAVNEEQATALEVLQAKIEELEESEGGTQQSTTVDIPTVLVDGGVVENVSVNNNSTKTQHVTFTTEFTEIPKVMVAIGKNVGAVSQYGYLSANILYPSVTTTGFDFFLANRTGSDRSPGVVWYAYQRTVETIDLDITIPDAQGMTESQVRAITGPISAAVDAIKTGYDGTVYQTAAEAVRTQVNDLHVLIENQLDGGLTADVKAALLACFNHVAWDSADPTGQSYISALQTALYPPANLSSISAVYTQPGTVYDTATLDSLKANLVVTAHYSDSTTETVTNYTLSGTLAEGTSTITVSYGGKTTTFNVTVTEYEPVTETISWSGSGTDKTSSLIDATQMTAYLTIPFESEASQLVEGATAESQGMKIRTYVYSDSAAQNLVGYYYIDTEQIETTGRTTANSPWCLFDTEMVAVPQGYYGTVKISRQGTSVFADNSSCGTYLNAYATSVEMR